MKDPMKFGIIGCGRIAQRHAGHIASKGVLVAVCDIVHEKADELADKYKAQPYYTTRDFLAKAGDMEVVAVCSPNGLHKEHTVQALEKGFHVLCEKPMAIKTKDAAAMIQASEKAGKHLFVVKQNRFNPPVAAVKEAIDAGKLGKIYSVQLNCFWNRNPEYYLHSWKGTQMLDGGTLFTQFSHFIDLLYWMFGEVKNVQAFLNNYAHKGIIEVEDTGVVLLEFDNGVLGTINYTVNSYRKNMEGSLTVFGERGTVKIGGQYLNELEYQCIGDYRIENLPQGNKANDYGTYHGSMSNHDKVYDHLIEALSGSRPFSTNAFESLKTVEIIERIYAQARWLPGNGPAAGGSRL